MIAVSVNVAAARNLLAWLRSVSIDTTSMQPEEGPLTGQ
jgi:hypothetical protein